MLFPLLFKQYKQDSRIKGCYYRSSDFLLKEYSCWQAAGRQAGGPGGWGY